MWRQMFSRKAIQRLWRDTGGNVMLTFSLAFPVLLGAAGLAVDSASFYDQQSRMQSIADATSLAVAKELHLYRKKQDEISELKEVGRTRVDALLSEAGIVDRPHTTEVAVDLDHNKVVVDIAMQTSSLLPVEVWGENPIRVSSEAHAYGQSRLCILGLHPDKSKTIKADGALLTAPDCAVQSNSKDKGGLEVSGGGKLISTVICTSGGYKGGIYEPPPTTDCPVLDDPLAERQAPVTKGCDYLDRVIGGGRVSISPGTYCGGLKIDSDASVRAEPGIYVIVGGRLEVKAKATLTGEYVSFVFQDSAATLEFDPKTTIDLSAPKDGAMAGILFYENRLAPLDRKFTIKSEHANRLLGTIYLPRGTLKIDAKAKVADLSAYTVIVARQIEVKDANLVVNSDYGGTDVPVPEGVGPNSQFVRVGK